MPLILFFFWCFEVPIAICKDIVKKMIFFFFFFGDIVGIKKKSFTNCKSNFCFALVCGIRMDLFIRHNGFFTTPISKDLVLELWFVIFENNLVSFKFWILTLVKPYGRIYH